MTAVRERRASATGVLDRAGLVASFVTSPTDGCAVCAGIDPHPEPA